MKKENLNVSKMTEDKKKDQIRSLMEQAEKEGRTIDWATVVLCWIMNEPITIQKVTLGEDGHLAIEPVMTLRVDKDGHAYASIWD